MYLPLPDTLMESDVWIDEAYNPLTPGLSTAVPERPAYMQLSVEPLGVPGAFRKGPKLNPSQANLEKLFPDCELLMILMLCENCFYCRCL